MNTRLTFFFIGTSVNGEGGNVRSDNREKLFWAPMDDSVEFIDLERLIDSKFVHD